MPEYDFTGTSDKPVEEPDLSGGIKNESPFIKALSQQREISTTDFDLSGLTSDKPTVTFQRLSRLPVEGLKDWARRLGYGGRLAASASITEEGEGYAPYPLKGGEQTKSEVPGFQSGDNFIVTGMNQYKINQRIEELENEGFKKDAEDQARKDILIENRQKSMAFWENIAKMPELQTAPEYEGTSSGLLEDVIRSMSGSAPDIVAIALNPALGWMAVASSVYGGSAENLEKQGVSDERAHTASLINTAVATPLEVIGESLQLRAIFKGAGTWMQRLLMASEAFGGEALTEYAQDYPETVTSMWAMNPDLSSGELIEEIENRVFSLDFQKQAGYNALVGGFSGLLTVGVGTGLKEGLDFLITDKQKQINEEKKARFKEIITSETPTEEDVNDLIKMTGMPENLANKIKEDINTPDGVKKTVEKIKNRVLFQSEPILSENRESIYKAIESHPKFTKEMADTYMAINDGIAYSLFADGSIEKPSDYYKMFRFEASGEAVTSGDALMQYDESGNIKTETPEFKNWFGDSKVVDDDGQPLVVYHGTKESFNIFDFDKLGLNTGADSAEELGFFFSGENVAGEFGENLIPVYLSIKNPMVIDGLDFTNYLFGQIDHSKRINELKSKLSDLIDIDEKFTTFSDAGIEVWFPGEESFKSYQTLTSETNEYGEEANDIITELLRLNDMEWAEMGEEFGYSKADWKALKTNAQKNGHDGIIVDTEDLDSFLEDYDIESLDELSENNYIVFSPTQIKSTDNQGTFDPNNPNMLYQGSKKKLGAIENLFTDEPAVLKAFASANPSTPIHETGHFLTKILYQHRPEDFKIIADWVGAKQDTAIDQWSTGQLEKVARGFERYVMEGKAPTMRLYPVFQKLKSWMVKIYRTIKALDVEISDPVRDVFDRILSTPEERASDPFIYELAGWYNVDDIKTKPSIEDLQEYEAVSAEARRRVVARMKAKREKEDDKVKKEFRRIAREQADDNEMYDAIDYVLSQGGLLAEDIKGRFGQAVYEDLLKRRVGLVTKSGIDPDRLANDLGYEFADQLVDAILDTPSKSVSASRIFDQLWAEYEASFTDFDEETYSEVLDTEIEIINEILGDNEGKKKPTPDKTLKPFIRKSTGQIKDADYKELIAEFKRQEKVARDAYRAAMEEAKKTEDFKDSKERIRAGKEKIKKAREIARIKNRQKNIIKNIRQSHKDSSDRAKIHRRMKRYLKMPVTAIPIEYKEQISSILGNYISLPKTYQLVPRESIDALLKRAEEEGENVDVPRMILEGLLPKEREYGKVLPIDDLRTVAQLVDSIAHLGRTKGKLIAGEKIEDLNQTVDSLVERINTFWKVKYEDNPWSIANKAKKEKKQKVRRAARSFFAELEQMESTFRALDGFDDLGPVWEAVFKKIKDAENQELTIGAEYVGKLKGLFSKAGISGKQLSEEVSFVAGKPGEEQTITTTKEELLSIALNSGNDGNVAALKEGWGFTDQQLQDLWTQLSGKERQFIFDVWDLLESLWPMLEDVHYKHTGARLAKVEGFYYPLVFDRNLSRKAKEFDEKKKLDQMAYSSYHVTKPEHGNRITRTGGKMAPNLSLSVIQRHFQQTIHDITHQIPIRDAGKIISHEKFRKAVEGSLGQEVYSQMMPWLNNVARPKVDYNSQLDRFLGKVRRNATVVGLGLKLTVALKQQFSLTQTVEKVGLFNTLSGLKQFYTNPLKAIEEINKMDPSMKFRKSNWNRELQQLYNEINPISSNMKENVISAFFWLIQANDTAATYPSWYAGYKDGMKKFNDHDKAVEHANMVVRLTQPSASPKDLSTIQRGGKQKSELVKLFTMFTTFFMKFQNRMFETHRRYGLRSPNETDMFNLFRSYFWLLVVPSAASTTIMSLLSGGYDDKEPKDIVKKYGKDALSYYVGGVPFVRDIVNGATSDFGYSFTPATGYGEAMSRVTKNIMRSLEEGELKISYKDISTAIGYSFGLPSAQFNITIDGLLNLELDDPSTYKGLLFREKKRKGYKP